MRITPPEEGRADWLRKLRWAGFMSMSQQYNKQTQRVLFQRNPTRKFDTRAAI